MSNLQFGLLRIVGAVIIIIGLYLVLWGKDRDQNHFKSQEQPTVISDNQKEPKMQVGSSAERQVLQMDLEEKDKTDG